jgi:predicted dehydrogenase
MPARAEALIAASSPAPGQQRVGVQACGNPEKQQERQIATDNPFKCVAAWPRKWPQNTTSQLQKAGTMTIRAVVIGAGWAGEGHTIGLRDAGVEVVALFGRTPEPAYQRAAELGITDVRFDWRAGLDELRPEIVSIATPAASHRTIAEFAVERGCHVVCEKPLATNATDAQAMCQAVERAGLKHGYAATGRYAPAIQQTRQLLAEGIIGRVREIESFSYLNLPMWRFPYCWLHRLELGGGMLNNLFTHHLAQVLYVMQGAVHSVAGEARVLSDQVPIGPTIHDFRQLFTLADTWDSERAMEWRAADADMAYAVAAKIRLGDGSLANALFRASSLGSTPQPESLAFHGETGSLNMRGVWAEDDRIERLMLGEHEWTKMPIAEAITAGLPQASNPVQRCWNQFFREFLADVKGEGYAGYPTFHDGSTAAAVIEIAREGYDWKTLPSRE